MTKKMHRVTVFGIFCLVLFFLLNQQRGYMTKSSLTAAFKICLIKAKTIYYVSDIISYGKNDN